MKIANKVKTLQKLTEIFHILIEIVAVEGEFNFVEIHYLNIDEPFVKRVVIELGHFLVQVPKEQFSPIFMIVWK